MPVAEQSNRVLQSIRIIRVFNGQQKTQDISNLGFVVNQQLISLRTQPLNVTPNGCDSGTWQFEFEVEHGEVYSTTGYAGDLTGLVNECAGVPMLTGLTENLTEQAVLVTSGPDQNIWFEPINK